MNLKSLIICSLIALISSVSYGQNRKMTLFVDDEEDDSITKRYYELHDGHWVGIDFGLNMMLDGSFGRSFDGKSQFQNNLISSYNFRLNFIDHKIVLKEDHLGITIGAGYGHNSFDLMKNYVLRESYNNTTKEKETIESFDSLNYSYNKIRASYLQVPILLEITPNSWSWVSFGVVTGYRFGSTTKTLYEYQKMQYITKTKGDFNLNTFQCDGMIRFGYKSFGGYVSYSLVPVFKNKMVAINPLAFGVSFNY
jgi:hypothetical protein